MAVYTHHMLVHMAVLLHAIMTQCLLIVLLMSPDGLIILLFSAVLLCEIHLVD